MGKAREFLKKHKVVVVGIVALFVGFMAAPYGVSEEEFNKVKSDYESVKTDLDSATAKVKDLEAKVKEAEPFFTMNDAEKEAMKIETEKKEAANKIEQEKVAEQKKKEEEAKQKAALEANSVTLGNGTYLVGKDIPEGVYDLFAVKGGGNVMSPGQANLIMGVKGDSEFYQREQQNVALKEGTSIELRTVTVKFVPDYNYIVK